MADLIWLLTKWLVGGAISVVVWVVVLRWWMKPKEED